MRLALLPLLFVCLFPTSLLGNPLLELTEGSEPDRPFSGRSASDSPITAYFNPARLSRAKDTIEVSYQSLTSRLSIQRSPRPFGYDVPTSVYGARIQRGEQLEKLPFRPFPTSDLPGGHLQQMDTNQTTHVLLFGAVIPLIKETLSVGVAGSLTAGYLQTQRPFYVDEREQFYRNELQFEFMGDRLEATTVSVALAYHPLPQLSLGFGGTLLNSSSSDPQIYIPDAGDQEDVETNPQIEVVPLFAPHFGLVYRPLGDQHLEISSAVHLASQAKLTGRGALRFWDFDYPDDQKELNQPFELMFQDQPLRVSLGLKAHLDLSSGRSLELYGDALWAQWSDYTDRHLGRPSDWSDTLSGALGARIQFGTHAVGLGMRYTPTPTPEQQGRTNYVDNNRMAAQLGWRKSWALETAALSLGLGLQAVRFLERTHVKSSDAETPIVDEFPDAVDVQTGEPIPESFGLQTNNPGFPGFESDGWAMSTFLTLRLER